MGKACSVCSLDTVAAFDADSDAGLSVRALAAKYSVSLGAVNRHREHRAAKAVLADADPDQADRHARSGSETTKPKRRPKTEPLEGMVPEGYPDGWRERLTKMATDLEDRGKLSRVRFLRGLGRDFVRRETVPLLAEVWGMPENTVKSDTQTAWISVRLDEESAEIARAAFWQDVFEEIDQAQELRQLATDTLKQAQEGTLYENYMTPEGERDIRVIEPMGIKFLADNFDRAANAAARCRDAMARATGIISSNTNVAIKLDVLLEQKLDVPGFGEGVVRIGDVRDALPEFDDFLRAAHAHLPEALRAQARNLRRRMKGQELVTVEAPALPAKEEA